ncbi:MAG: hypothetical protein AAFP82_18725, partial [Bacteroidota bacterium]
NSLDLMNATSEEFILSCITEVNKGDSAFDKEKLPKLILGKLGEEMEKNDPLSNIEFNLSCPNCSHQWTVVFDIIDYLWMEIDNWAKHLLQEIFTLAKAFGWSEKQILNLSTRRRQYYLQMINA